MGDNTMPNYDEDAELRKADTERWICRLKINPGSGETLNGTGFLVNFRDSPKIIIMTAGHNIVQNKKRVTSIEVFFSEKLKVLNNKKTAAGNQLFVSTEYEQDPENDIKDYGLIVFDGPKLGGLAFSALITDQTLKKIKRVNVAGYLSGELERAGGAFAQINDNQLSYRVATKQGISGGPIWVDYQRCDTVVGIHNYGKGQGKVLSGFRCTRLTKDVILVMATWAGGFRLNTPIYTQFTPESEKRYLRISSGSIQGGKNSTRPSVLVCIPTQDEKAPRFDIIPMQAPQCTKEVGVGEDDDHWKKYIYVICPVVGATRTRPYLGHTRRKPGTPSDRNNILRTWEWAQDDAAKDVGWILYRPIDRNGFHLLRTPDMGKAASGGGEFVDSEIEVLAFIDTPMPLKTECGRRREIGCSEGITFKSFLDKDRDTFRFNAEPDT